jgi:hypothetical protein
MTYNENKLVCKVNDNPTKFTIGKIYNSKIVSHTWIGDNTTHKYVRMIADDGEIWEYDIDEPYFNINDYFMTLKENRKMKLKTIEKTI